MNTHGPRSLVLSAVACVALGATSASAQLAIESANYTADINLTNPDIGNASGFTGTWTRLAGGDMKIGTGNLANLGGTGSGTNHIFADNVFSVASYNLANTYGADGTTLSISFTMDSTFTPGTSSFGGLFTPGGIYVGQDNDQFVLAPDGGSAGVVGQTGASVLGLRFLQINFNFLPGNDSITLNVFDGNGDLLGSATRTDLNVSIGALGLVSEQGKNGGINTAYRFDEITLSTAPIPEPSAFAALGGVAALGFAALRRRART